MKGQIVYLDSSAIIKRYVKEPGSDQVREYYRKLYSGDLKISYSLWNIGEVLGAFDKARQTNRLDENMFKTVKERFLLETRRTVKLGVAVIVPIRTKILVEAWKLVEDYHIYEADALQIATAKHLNAEIFLTADRKLHEIAEMEDLKSIYLG
ncbi:type II toxin-antitoxin system VapC family toxin [Candidatus Bathyarchaeota archaeon]|nr:type II toxin-antitoxin system VapC family toxin [Candidatus Bathyarchaeota archaeon]MBS7612889.1 type II toxin-antitoxin system VapC family toxin [Candidatus Bathyarchaeota archaeon]MBS7618270.1 type II toxin-antitoxin system VapC family toxin [Candidatus Bathyarchaeota archaeon]